MGVFEFDYSYWAGWEVGSSATLEDQITKLERRFTLIKLDGDSAVLEHMRYHSQPGGIINDSSQIIVPARAQETPLIPLGRNQISRVSFDEIVQPVSMPDPTAEPVIAEGHEVIEAGGDDMHCRWFEKLCLYWGNECLVKYWVSRGVPGGIVRWHIRKTSEEFPHVTLKLKSFERK